MYIHIYTLYIVHGQATSPRHKLCNNLSLVHSASLIFYQLYNLHVDFTTKTS